MELTTVKDAIAQKDFKLFEERLNTVAVEDGSDAADHMIKEILDSLEEEDLAWLISCMPEDIQNLVKDSGYNALVALAESGGYEHNIDIWKTEEGFIKLTTECYNYLLHVSDESGKALLKSVEVNE